MDITISVSVRAEEIIRDKAEERGKEMTQFLGEFVESTFVAQTDRSDGLPNPRNEHSLMRFAGVFRSSVNDTSERMHEILYSDDLDASQGFGTDK